METRMARVQQRNAELEDKVNSLEMENRWLKDLITEKNRTAASDDGDDLEDLDPALRGTSGHASSVTEDTESNA
jgi:hypothetical protein